MYKAKIIQKNYRTRERMREERGLQREFTTYHIPQGLQMTEKFQELQQISSSTPSEELYIILEQSLWRSSQLIGPWYQEMNYSNEEPVIFQGQNSALQEINAKYRSMVCCQGSEQSVVGQKIKFDVEFKVKPYSQEGSVVQINSIAERVECVRFREQSV